MSICDGPINWFGIVAINIACMSLFGCAPSPLLKYSLNTPAATLHPLGQAPVIDGRVRFREILCAVEADHGVSFPDRRPCEQILHRLIDEPEATKASATRVVNLNPLKAPTTVVFVPGIFGECVEKIVVPFSDTYEHLKTLGYSVHFIHLSGRSSSDYNAQLLRKALILIKSDRFVVIAYSKGVPDMLQMLVSYPEMAEKIRALVSISGVVSGTPIADGFSDIYGKFFGKLSVDVCPAGDGGGVRSLTREARMSWLSKNKLPLSVDFYSLVSFAQRDRISAPLLPFSKLLEKVDARNDGQMIYYDAILPGSILLGYVNGDHWAVALPFNRSNRPSWRALIDHNDFPREIVIESVLRFVDENTPP